MVPFIISITERRDIRLAIQVLPIILCHEKRIVHTKALPLIRKVSKHFSPLGILLVMKTEVVRSRIGRLAAQIVKFVFVFSRVKLGQKFSIFRKICPVCCYQLLYLISI